MDDMVNINWVKAKQEIFQAQAFMPDGE